MEGDEGVGALKGSAVHVTQQTDDGDMADSAAEEEVLYGVRGDSAQTGQQEQQLAEPAGLGGIARTHVLGERQLRLVLERGHRGDVTEAASLNHWKRKNL